MILSFKKKIVIGIRSIAIESHGEKQHFILGIFFWENTFC
jgi:hypothetical protein